MAERTRGPWRAQITGQSPVQIVIRSDGTGEEQPIAYIGATIYGQHEGVAEAEANAEFIARSANAHDALLAAALAALERCVACGHERQWHGERDCTMCAERDVLDACRTFRVDEGLRAAIALAEERDDD